MGEVFVVGEAWNRLKVRLSRSFGGWNLFPILDECYILTGAERPMCRSASVGRYLLTSKYRRYVGAEIPPVGAPAGFDSAAMVNSAFDLARRCRSAQNDMVGCLFGGLCN